MRSERKRAGVTIGSLIKVDLYTDLVGRFERLLAYASTLQARLRRHERQRGRFERLSRENSRLKARIGLDDIYIALLEQALESSGILPVPKQPAAPIEAVKPEIGWIAREQTGERRLRLAGMPRWRVAP